MVDLALTHVERPPDDLVTDAPALIVLHGHGADERGLLWVAEDLPADRHVLSVRAPHAATSGGYAWMSSWPDPFAESVEQLAAFAERVPEAYDVDPARIGLLGFSQGAKAALLAMVAHPDLFDRVVSLHGYLPRTHVTPGAVARASGTPVFVGVGEADTVIAPEHGEETADRLADAGYDVTFRSYPVGHHVAAAAVTDVAEWLGSPH